MEEYDYQGQVGKRVTVVLCVPLYEGEDGTVTGWNSDGWLIVHLDEFGQAEFRPEEIEETYWKTEAQPSNPS